LNSSDIEKALMVVYRADMAVVGSTPAQTRLSTKEIADYLGVHPITIKVWRREKIGPPFYRQVGRVWYDLDQITEWREKNTERCGL
jgi:hypothetical protein